MNSTTTHHVGFVSEPNCGRGTVGLLWQCLTTIFLCIWSAQHMDIPARALSKKLAFLRSLFAIVLGIVCPELMCARALIQWYAAGRMIRLLEEQKIASISKKQAFFIQMGGLQPMLSSERVLALVTIAPSAFEEVLREPLGRDFVSELLNHLPTDNEIDDKSKSDLLAKIIVCVQASWTAAQIVARLERGMDLSLLEVATSSYILLALIAYTFWFRKPYNVTVGVPFAIDDRSYSRLVKIDYHSLSKFDIIADGPLMTPAIYGNERDDSILFFLVATFGLILAAIHCAAWNYTFPSRVEAIMWQTCSVLAGTSLWSYAVAYCYLSPDTSQRHRLDPLLACLASLSLFIYIVARVYLVVEVFASLGSAPAETYQQISWSSYFGHIGS